MSRRSATLVLLVLVVGFTGCGISAQTRPDPLPRDRVPFGLLSPDRTSPDPRQTPRPEVVVLYLLNRDRLVAVTSYLPWPATLDVRLAALAAGPSKTQAANGLRSA
ncbi:MAG: hypothetical protein ACRDXE_10930, partial [Acidimicrobiales bacterium]